MQNYFSHEPPQPPREWLHNVNKRNPPLHHLFRLLLFLLFLFILLLLVFTLFLLLLIIIMVLLHVILSFSGRLHVCEDLAAEQARRDAGVFQARCHLSAGRQTVPNVQGGGPSQLPHCRCQHEGQAHQVQADSGR